MTVAEEFDGEEIEYEEYEEEAEIQEGNTPPDASLPGLQLVFEDRPVKATRSPAAPKELAWEEYLNFLKAKPGVTVRVFLFAGEDAAKLARSRARSMRARLVKTQPADMWEITAESVKEDGSWRVYASYEGPASPEIVADRARIHAERVERGLAVAALRFGK